MTRIATSDGARTYRSQLRTQQAEQTRARILDATVRVMAGGLAFVSVPQVAREAGVSVPTVYRHFPDRLSLFEGLVAEVGDQSSEAANKIISRGGPAARQS